MQTRAGLTGLAAMHVPAGFQVEKVTTPYLVSYPMLGTIDDRGRLFVCESSGNTLNDQQMAKNPDYVIRMLEDTNGDGIYDQSKIFARNLTLPAGAVWYRGSLYVASPPDLLRFTDTDGDGIADRREVIVTGWTMASNAASLHGPFLGPDGWLYLTDGRHGYNIKTKEGTVLKGEASRIWRVRPDGTGLEWVAGGGFDNPVELIFTVAGETIGTMTYFTDPMNGQRDALLHFVEGGVYPKWYSVVSEFKRTGDLMPVMTKFARIAPAGLVRYRSPSFGGEYEGNLFSAQFNPHRVQRHKLFRDGATFRTEDEDFLTSRDPDFHPTDVIEDADGSLLVVDTGAWFIHGCPISRIAKPEIKGAIYRVRKTGAAQVSDPYGKNLKLAEMPSEELVKLLEDERFAVRDLALDQLVQKGEAATDALAGVRASSRSVEARAKAVFALGQIGSPKAQEAVRAALDDSDFQVRVAGARVAGMARDRASVDKLINLVRADEAPVRRQAATALGQIGDTRAVPALLGAAPKIEDRFTEHAIIYALIGLKTPGPVMGALSNRDPKVRKAALIALDQMDGNPLRREQFRPFLSDPDQDIRSTALWVVSHHPQWSGDVLSFLRARLRAPSLPDQEIEPVRQALLSFCADPAAQSMVGESLVDAAITAERKVFLLDTIDRCQLKELPRSWMEQTGEMLDKSEPRVRARAVALIRSHQITGLDDRLERIAADGNAPDDLRTAALGVLVSRRPKLDDSSVQFLLGRLQAGTDAAQRLSAAQVLSRAELSDDQLRSLANGYLSKADPLVLPNLLEAFRKSKSPTVGEALVSSLLKSSASIGESEAKGLDAVLQNYPPSVQSQAKPLLARIQETQKARAGRLQQLEPLLTAGGDVGRGRRIFFGDKVACASCHTIGTEGGHVGPDLTAVGAIRSGHDLLEAIVFPSASFVPGHEVYRVDTASESYAGIIKEKTPEAIVLVTGPNEEVRLAREKVVSMRLSDVSLMPEGLDGSLSQTEFTDLLAFLQAQKARDTEQLTF